MTTPEQPHGLNFFEIDRDLHFVLQGLDAKAAKRWHRTLHDFGAWAGGPLDDEAAYTDRHAPPRLVPYDRTGRLINHVATNPLWDEAAREIYRRGIVGLNHVENPAPYIVTFAMGYLTSQSDVSLHCPATMTHAVAHVLARFAPRPVRERYLHALTRMDGKALSAGTWATELHGGSDIGATTTIARRNGDHFRLTGLKWFTSNVNGGIAIATARPEGAPKGSEGLGLYLVPTTLPDGSANPMRIRRLKDKLGTVGVATGEVDLTDTWAMEVAPPPDGFRLMMEALVVSRIHNAMSAVALQRRAFLEALCFAANREAFGGVILNYPMVQDELAAMLVEREADLALAFEAAHAFDRAAAIPVKDAGAERAWLRLATSLAKYQTAENANTACRKAIELIGGNGYTYDRVTPRLLRDAQVLTVWEGPANIQALEVLRLIDPRYGGFDLFAGRIEGIADKAPAALKELSAGLRAALELCRHAGGQLKDRVQAQRHARRFMALLAETLALGLLVEQASREKGGDRKALVARAYGERHFPPPREKTFSPGSGWIHEAFGQMLAPDLEALQTG